MDSTLLIKEKLAQAAALVAECGFGCWLTFTRESEVNGDPVLPFLVPGPVTWHSAFIVTPDGQAHAIVGRYDRATVEGLGAYTHISDFVTSFREPFLELMQRLDPPTIAVNFSEGSEICDGLTYGMFLTLRTLLGELGMADRIVSAEPLVSALRERKTPMELEAIREAVATAEAIFEEAGRFIAPGRKECEIAAFMQAEVRRRGLDFAWNEATCPSVFTGPDTAEAHFAPSERVVQPGHLVTMDFGVRIAGYCSDLQRTFYVRRPGEVEAPGAVRRGFEVLTQAIEAARRALRPGVEGWTVDAAARDRIVAAGYEPFPFGLGHQVGRFAHDGTALLGPLWPKYAHKPLRPVAEGMVFTLEPRLSVPDHGIVSIEEMVVVTPGGASWLSQPQTSIRYAGA